MMSLHQCWISTPAPSVLSSSMAAEKRKIKADEWGTPSSLPYFIPKLRKAVLGCVLTLPHHFYRFVRKRPWLRSQYRDESLGNAVSLTRFSALSAECHQSDLIRPVPQRIHTMSGQFCTIWAVCNRRRCVWRYRDYSACCRTRLFILSALALILKWQRNVLSKKKNATHCARPWD